MIYFTLFFSQHDAIWVFEKYSELLIAYLQCIKKLLASWRITDSYIKADPLWYVFYSALKMGLELL